MRLDTRTKLFVVLTGIFVTVLVVGDLIGGKLMQKVVGDIPFVISVAMIPFPITFLLTDLLNEFYGKQTARFVTWVGFFMASLAFAIIAIGKALPWAGILPVDKIVSIIVTSYAVKLLIAIGLTPFIYAGHAIVERWLGIQPVRLDAEGKPLERLAAVPTSA